MGAEPYWYFVDYQPDVSAALETLRQREFEAGRYNPVMMFPEFPVGPNSPSPGSQHATIEQAMEASAEDGTRSILDLSHVSDHPEFCAVAPLDDSMLTQCFGTNQPTREMLEQNMDLMEEIERGQGVYVILYKDGQPDQLFFAGYSFD